MPSSAGAIRAGRAFVEAFLDSSQLEKQLGKVRDRLKMFSRQVAAIGGGLAAAGAAIVLPLAAAVKHFSAVGDQLDKMSKRTGFAVETLSALDFAASQSGASVEQLDKALAAMARFALQANRGLTTATDTLSELGLTVDDITTGTGEQKFFKLAEAISKIEDPTLKAGMALQVFGRQGRELLPMLQGGEQGIQALMARAQELGIVMSTEDATAAAEMTDALDELMRSLKFLVVTVARELIPQALEFSRFITDTVPHIREWLQDNGELIVSLAKLGAGLAAAGGGLVILATLISSASTVIGVAQSGVKLLGGGLAGLGKISLAAFAIVGILSFAREIYRANSAVQDLNRELEKAKELNDELNSRQQASNDEILTKANSMSGADRDAFVSEELEKAEKNLTGLNNQLNNQKRVVDDLAPTWRSLWQAGRANYKAEKEDLTAINDRLKNQKKFVAELRRLQAAQQAEFDANAGRTDEEMQGIDKILGQLNEQLETFGLDAGQKALRELEKLNANESELATARQKLAEISKKQADAEAAKAEQEELKAAEEKARQAAESINQMLQALADEVADLSLDPADREKESRLRQLRRLGANEEQLAEAERLLDDKAGLAGEVAGNSARPSPTIQGGTFSALASQIFSSGKDNTQKNIENATRETADNTRKIAKRGNSITVTV